MHNLSMTQALSVWTDLIEAYYGRNGYGGNVAEVYVYRLQPRNHVVELRDGALATNAKAELARTANRSLHALLTHFAETVNASIEVEGRPLGDWLRDEPNDWRWHIEVQPRDGAEP